MMSCANRNKGGWYYNDESGNNVFNKKFAVADPFYEGIAFVKIKVNDKWSSINKKGERITKHRYQYMHHFSEGVAPVKIGKWGVINSKDEMLVAPEYDYILPCSEGLMPAQLGGK